MKYKNYYIIYRQLLVTQSSREEKIKLMNYDIKNL